MAIFLTTYRSSIVPFIQAVEPLKDKVEITEEAETALSTQNPTSLIAIQIISVLGEKISARLRQQNLEELAQKVILLTEEYILSASLQLRTDKSSSLAMPLEGRHKAKQDPTILETLPQTVLCHIFSFIDPLDNVALTCRAFRDCAQLVTATRILSQPQSRISLFDFGLTPLTQELDFASAHRFLYHRQKILEIIKKTLPFQLIQDIDSQVKPLTVPQFVNTAYSYQIIQLFGQKLSQHYREYHDSLSYIQREISHLRDKIAAYGNTFRTLEYISQQEPLTCIPKAIRFCTTLVTLHISNSLIRKLPDEVRNLKRLENLSVERNCLTELPEALGECEHLQVINIEFNLMKRIPSKVLSLPHLQLLQADEDVGLPQAFEQTHSVVRSNRENVEAYRLKRCRQLCIPLP